MRRITTEDLVAFYHIQSCIDNNAVAAAIIKEVEDLVNCKFNFIHSNSPQQQELKLTQQISEFLGLKNSLYTSSDVDEFLLLLKKYHYNMKHEIIDAIRVLSNLKCPNHNKETILELLVSPVIDDIYFNGIDKFTIVSEMYGTFSFFLATSYFKDHSDVLQYISKESLKNYCHVHTEKLSEIFPMYKSITSLCSHYFLDYYYHSYTFNPDDLKVIDLCSRLVMDIKEYNCLFEPREVSVVPNDSIENLYAKVLKKTKQPIKRHLIFKIALYNQLKNMDRKEKKSIKAYKKSQ